MSPLVRILLGGAIAVLAFDAIASVASQRLGFEYGSAAVGSGIIYTAIGFLAAGRGGVQAAALAGATMGLVDATLGWAVSWAIGPVQVPRG